MNKDSIVDRIDSIADTFNLSIDTPVTTAKLEATGICNMDCRFCYNKTMREKKERQRFITKNDFSLMLDALLKLETIKEVGMFYMGESVFHPDLVYFYKTLKEYNFFTYLTTSFGVMMIDKLSPCIRYIDSLKISWNFKNYYDFHEKTGRTLEEFTRFIYSINKIYDIVHHYNKKLSISTVLDYNESINDYDFILSKLKYDEHYFLPVQSQGGTYKEGKQGVVGEYNKQSSPLPCWSLFKGFYVDCEMNVRTCAYGHMKEHILMNLYNGFSKEEYYKQKRKYLILHINGIIPTICKKCLNG